jgi:hypothetical protein
MSVPGSAVNTGGLAEGRTALESQDQTIEAFPIARVPVFRRLRESISSTCQVRNFASPAGRKV